MKKLITSIAFAILMTGSFVACKKKADAVVAIVTPTPTPSVALPAAVVSRYIGTLTYTGTPNVSELGATATISGTNPYTITFSNGVPPINNLKFADGGNGNYTSIAENGSVAGMTITTTRLTVGLTSGGATWGFDGTK